MSELSWQRLYDRLWFFVTESLLAFTIFRDDFDILFALMFGFLLFIKSFHWLAADRIEWVSHISHFYPRLPQLSPDGPTAVPRTPASLSFQNVYIVRPTLGHRLLDVSICR
jgi:hypothetical protein